MDCTYIALRTRTLHEWQGLQHNYYGKAQPIINLLLEMMADHDHYICTPSYWDVKIELRTPGHAFAHSYSGASSMAVDIQYVVGNGQEQDQAANQPFMHIYP